MSVSSTTTKVSASGDASTAGFNYTFKIFADSEMQVIIRASNGVETIKTLSTHYNVSGAGADAGGTVTLPAATFLHLVRLSYYGATWRSRKALTTSRTIRSRRRATRMALIA